MIKIKRKLWPALMLVGILALYLLLPTKNYFWDGVDFAQHIEDATKLDASLIHPNHLFYNAFGYLVYRTTHAFGMSLRTPRTFGELIKNVGRLRRRRSCSRRR